MRLCGNLYLILYVSVVFFANFTTVSSTLTYKLPHKRIFPKFGTQKPSKANSSTTKKALRRQVVRARSWHNIIPSKAQNAFCAREERNHESSPLCRKSAAVFCLDARPNASRCPGRAAGNLRTTAAKHHSHKHPPGAEHRPGRGPFDQPLLLLHSDGARRVHVHNHH